MTSDEEWRVYIGECFDTRRQCVGSSYYFGTPHTIPKGATVVLGPYLTRLEAVAELLECAPVFVLAYPDVLFVQDDVYRAAEPLFVWGQHFATDSKLKALYGRLRVGEDKAFSEAVAREIARKTARANAN